MTHRPRSSTLGSRRLQPSGAAGPRTEVPERTPQRHGYSGLRARSCRRTAPKVVRASNGSYSKFVGTTHLQMGATTADSSRFILNPVEFGLVRVRTRVHLLDRENNNQHDRGQLGRSSCSAIRPRLASSEHVTLTTPSTSHPLLRRLLQDDWSVNSKFTSTRFARRARDGARGEQNHFRSASTRPRHTRCPTSPFPADLVGRHVGAQRGRGCDDGVDGKPTQQGQPPKATVVAAGRRRVFASIRRRLLRAAYGILMGAVISGAEHTRPAIRNRSASPTNRQPQTAGTPDRVAEQSSPTASPRSRSAAGTLSGVGTTIATSTNRVETRVQQ